MPTGKKCLTPTPASSRLNIAFSEKGMRKRTEAPESAVGGAGGGDVSPRSRRSVFSGGVGCLEVSGWVQITWGFAEP